MIVVLVTLLSVQPRHARRTRAGISTSLALCTTKLIGQSCISSNYFLLRGKNHDVMRFVSMGKVSNFKRS